jgi:sterol 3beta-glucosyltransferase
MNISVVAVGTRGDVEPHMALATRLTARGHRVTLAAPTDFQRRSQALGLTFHPINVGLRDLYHTQAGAALLASANRPLEFIRQLKRIAIPIAEQVIVDIREACRGADAVYYSLLGLPAYYVAKELGIPSVATSMQPMGRTRSFPSPLYSSKLRLPGSLNRLTHLIVEQGFWQLCRPLMKDRFRSVRFWGPFNELYRNQSPMLLAYSPSVVQRPEDYGPAMHVTGFWRLPLDIGWKPPASLAAFLSAGPPPICVGFGSMNSGRIDGMMATVLGAVAEARRRAIVLTGWWDHTVGTDLLGDDVYVTEAVPHSWLFPRVATVVHHGGAGTTAAALSAGVPSIVAPFFFDQWFWGRCLYAQGLGPEPISRRSLSTSSVRKTLEEVEHSVGFRRRLATVSRQLLGEDGVGTAIDAIEEAWSGRRSHPVSMAAE